jgi:hypothetical protein
MNGISKELVSHLSCGKHDYIRTEKKSSGLVEILAKVYEKARNALEYRADNLVRRAAIERILKRRIILSKNPKTLAENLLTELKWAKYLSVEEIKKANINDLLNILDKYVSFLDSGVPQDWVVKIASAEIEELVNLNTDYNQFTFFAFQVVKKKIKLTDPNLDLITYFAVDKVYGGSDDEQIAYHIFKLAGSDVSANKFSEAWRLFNLAKNHKDLSRISKFVRRQMPPVVLLRDIYFSEPDKFAGILEDEGLFKTRAAEVLTDQLRLTSAKISTAGIRSVLYVFLTKMVLAFGIEVPFEILFYGRLYPIPLILNLIFPPFIMWISTIQIRPPDKKEQELLIERTWYVMQNFEELGSEEDVLTTTTNGGARNLTYVVFTALYAIFFVGIFAMIIYVLNSIGYTLFSELIFIFFLTVISYFAYRIGQIANVYSWKEIGTEQLSFLSTLSLPILAVGSRLSSGLSKLNFLAFTLDFILEAPFKMILSFVDDWFKFLSAKKDEHVIE